MANLSWFKHYNTAHEGLTLRTLWCDGEFEAYSLFWVLLELISKYENESNRGKIKVSMSFLRRETGWNLQRLSRVLTKIGQTSSEVDGIQVLINLDQTCELSAPKWLELQEHRGGKNKAKTEQNTGRGKRREERGKSVYGNCVPDTPTEGIAEQIRTAWETFGKSLVRLGIPARNLSPPDEISLSESIRHLGFQNVLDALEGVGYETGDENFSPKKFVSLDYCLKKNQKTQKSNWERLGNLARSKRALLENEEAELKAAKG